MEDSCNSLSSHVHLSTLACGDSEIMTLWFNKDGHTHTDTIQSYVHHDTDQAAASHSATQCSCQCLLASFGSSSFFAKLQKWVQFLRAKLFRVWLPRTENFLHHILKRSQYIYYVQEIWMFIDCQNISKVQTAWMFSPQRKLPNYINSLVWWLSSHPQAAERRVVAVKTFPNICMLWGFFYQHFWEVGF